MRIASAANGNRGGVFVIRLVPAAVAASGVQTILEMKRQALLVVLVSEIMLSSSHSRICMLVYPTPIHKPVYPLPIYQNSMGLITH